MAHIGFGLGGIVAHDGRVRRRLGELLTRRPVELEDDTSLRDPVDGIGVDEPVLLSELVLCDHDSVKNVLALIREDVRHFPDLLIVGAVHRDARFQHLVRNLLAEIHTAKDKAGQTAPTLVQVDGTLLLLSDPTAKQPPITRCPAGADEPVARSPRPPLPLLDRTSGEAVGLTKLRRLIPVQGEDPHLFVRNSGCVLPRASRQDVRTLDLLIAVRCERRAQPLK